MGYTHYFQQQKNINNNAWNKTCDDVEKILFYCKKNKIKLVTNCEDTKNIIQKELGIINFNGVGNNEHETFEITKQKPTDARFNFCKTARKPYDLAACATLLIIHHHNPRSYDIRSDGGVVDWEDAAELNFKLFQYGFKFPKSIAETDPQLAKEIQNKFQDIVNIQISKDSLEENLKPITKTNKVKRI